MSYLCVSLCARVACNFRLLQTSSVFRTCMCLRVCLYVFCCAVLFPLLSPSSLSLLSLPPLSPSSLSLLALAPSVSHVRTLLLCHAHAPSVLRTLTLLSLSVLMCVCNHDGTHTHIHTHTHTCIYLVHREAKKFNDAIIM